jgi:tRNA 2-selenouridine synthase
MQRPNDSNDYRRIFLYDVPILDTRAPLEFARGAFPCAVNVPLMNDEEREQVGRCYKASGQQAALELGHQLVRGSVKDQRVAAWKNFVAEHPQGYLYCFRVGLS